MTVEDRHRELERLEESFWRREARCDERACQAAASSPSQGHRNRRTRRARADGATPLAGVVGVADHEAAIEELL